MHKRHTATTASATSHQGSQHKTSKMITSFDEESQRTKSDEDSQRASVRSNASAVVRRLADNDVRAIFECIHDNKPRPEHLPFTIVPVGTSGLKLSPPSYEFEGKNLHDSHS